MLKFLNRNKEGKVRECHLAITSVQEGALVEATLIEEGGQERREDIFLTPMDAAYLISDAKAHDSLAFAPVGHGADGSDIRAWRIGGVLNEWIFVGGMAEACIRAGDIKMVVPAFVIEAICIALKGMMGSLMYPTTGDQEEEFG